MTENEASQLGHDEGKLVMTDPDRKMKDNETFCGGCEIDDISPGHCIPIDIAANRELHNAFCCGVIYEIKDHYRDQAWRIREALLNKAPYGTNPDELNKQLLLELAADEIPRIILDEIAAYDAEETGYDEDEEEDNTVSVYFDGGGSVYVQHAAFCHVYEDGTHAAHDVTLLLAGADTGTWDNNEIDGWEAMCNSNGLQDVDWLVLPDGLPNLDGAGHSEHDFVIEMNKAKQEQDMNYDEINYESNFATETNNMFLVDGKAASPEDLVQMGLAEQTSIDGEDVFNFTAAGVAKANNNALLMMHGAITEVGRKEHFGSGNHRKSCIYRMTSER